MRDYDKELVNKELSSDEILLLNAVPAGVVSMADKELLVRCLSHLSSLGSNFIVEIGTCFASTTLFLCAACSVFGINATILTCDILDRRDLFFEKCSYWMDNGRAIFVQCDSTAFAFKLWSKAGIVFIDGCHCIDCLMKDIAIWRDRVCSGGFLAFHDTSESSQGMLDIHILDASSKSETRPRLVLEAIKRSQLSDFKLVDSSDDGSSPLGIHLYMKVA